MTFRVAFPAVLLLGLVSVTAQADNWPAWRGLKGDGTTKETSFPTRWSETENVKWKTELPGKGHSSPIIWGDRVFITWCLEDKNGECVLACLDRKNGKILWEKVVTQAKLEKIHKLNSYASATPATDGKHVWVAFRSSPDVVIACYDYEGKETWRVSPGKQFSVHGFCSCPILYKDMVILNCDQDAKGTDTAYIVALSKADGKERWRIDRPNKIRSYCAPLIVEAAGKMQLVLSGCKCVTSYDPDNGKQHWIIQGPTEQYVASLVYTRDLFFLSTGFPEYHLMAIKPDGTGDITKTGIAWHKAKLPAKEASYVPSPIAYEDYFFVVSDLGYASCFQAKTGERHWLEKLGRHHSASPVAVGDLLYFTADEGDTYIVKAGPKFEVVKKNPIGEECYSSPALADGQIFLRGAKHLFCIEESKKQTKK